MEARNRIRPEANNVSDVTLGCVFAYLDSPVDRRAVSQVCRQWKRVDANTRKHVQIANCYSVSPEMLSRRFPNLKSLKIKGSPRAREYELLPPNWGGYAKPWIAEVTAAYSQKFQNLWLRRMLVTDDDLTLLASYCSDSLLSLKLDKCLGFSSLGLAEITAQCRSLKVLYMEECEIQDSQNRAEWLHDLAERNYSLEELNFQYCVGLDYINIGDLEAIVKNCKSLRSLKVNDVDALEVLPKTSTLLELGAGECSKLGDRQTSPPAFMSPNSIISLSGLYGLSDAAVPMLATLLGNLKRLDLKYTYLTQEGHCMVLRYCFSLEVLEVRNVLGDDGLMMVARTCRNLIRIRVDEEKDAGEISPSGIIPVVQNCVKLEVLVMYVSDISNATLAAVADNCPQMKDCRFVLLPYRQQICDLPLDEGVKALLRGCQKLTRFALYVRHGALTDTGMDYIGQFGGRLKWILLGCAGETDWGLSRLAIGCQSLERLEMRDCPVSENGLADAAVKMKENLKFMWVQGYHPTEAVGNVLARCRPFWNVEICAGSVQIMAYNSLAGPRQDCPPDIYVISTAGDNAAHENGGF